MSKHVARLVAVLVAVVAVLAAAPALAGTTTTTTVGVTTTTAAPTPTTTTMVPTPTPLIAEPPCTPAIQPLGVRPRLPVHKHRPGHPGRPGVDNSLPTDQPEVDNSLPSDQPEVDNSLPSDQPEVDNSLPPSERGRLRRLLRLRLLRRLCGETPPVDENNASIEVRPANGEAVFVVRHPNHPWFALVNVGTDLAFLQRPGADDSAEWASAASGIIAGPGVTNSTVIDDRLVAQFSAPIATTVRVNDWFPAGLSSPRENTPDRPGPGGACTSNLAAINLVSNGAYDGRYKLPALNSGSLFDTNAGPGCISAAQLRRTPFDDVGAGAGLNRSDWINVGFGFSPAVNIRSQVVFRINWADGSQSVHLRQANTVSTP